ncbi:hypothetical protein GCM10027347_51010 [Larkinella harenae]
MLLFVALSCNPKTKTPDPLTPLACLLTGTIVKTDIKDLEGTIIKTSTNFTSTFTRDTSFSNPFGRTTYRFTYDQQGFLTKRMQSYSREPAVPNYPALTTVEETFSYRDGKLEEIVTRSTDDGRIGYQTTQRYNYDLAGNLVQYTSADSYGKKVIRTFENGIQKSYKTADASGQITDKTSNFNAQGYEIISFYSPELQFHNFYNANGSLTKREMWSEGRLTSYTELVYGPKSLQHEAMPHYKGHPTIPGLTGAGTYLVVKSTNYSVNPTNQQVSKSDEATMTYEFTKHGFVSIRTTHSTTFSADEKPTNTSISTETSIYDCPN